MISPPNNALERRGRAFGRLATERMTLNSHRILQVAAMTVVGYFIVFTVICWWLDLTGSDHQASQTRAYVSFDAGVVSGVLAFIGSLVLWRPHRAFAIAGFMACLLWMVWICLPRL